MICDYDSNNVCKVCKRESVKRSTRRCNGELTWAVAVTTDGRREDYLEQTLNSLEAAGWPDIKVNVDPDLGAWPNFWLTMVELVCRNPDATYYMIVQDDVVFTSNIREYVETQLGLGVYSLFCPKVYNRPKAGFNPVPCGYGLSAAQCFVFHREAAWAFLHDGFVVNHRRKAPGPSKNFVGDGLHHIDGVVGEFCGRSGIRPQYHSPSLAQHIGIESSMYPGKDRSKHRIYADTFHLQDAQSPYVTAIIVTNGQRPDMLADAIADFEAQDYNNKYLLVGGPHEGADVHLPNELTLGQCRNRMLREVWTDLVIQWDDDDRYRSDRIAYQVSKWKPGRCVVLGSQRKTNIETGESNVCVRPEGIAGTILHERVVHEYPIANRGEDQVFMNNFGQDNIIVCDNDPDIYQRQFHGGNTWNEEHVMRID